jgi:hypothetical protein
MLTSGNYFEVYVIIFTHFPLDARCFAVHTLVMPTRSSKDHDFVTVARSVVEQAIGEHLDGTALEPSDTGKNPHAVALGRLGGQKGGLARAEALSARKRAEIARKAAMTRWKAKK